MVEDVVVGFEDAVREPIVAHELPDVLDRIELGRFRRQRQERDVVWDGKPLRDMPSRPIRASSLHEGSFVNSYYCLIDGSPCRSLSRRLGGRGRLLNSERCITLHTV